MEWDLVWRNTVFCLLRVQGLYEPHIPINKRSWNILQSPMLYNEGKGVLFIIPQTIGLTSRTSWYEYAGVSIDGSSNLLLCPSNCLNFAAITEQCGEEICSHILKLLADYKINIINFLTLHLITLFRNFEVKDVKVTNRDVLYMRTCIRDAHFNSWCPFSSKYCIWRTYT